MFSFIHCSNEGGGQQPVFYHYMPGIDMFKDENNGQSNHSTVDHDSREYEHGQEFVEDKVDMNESEGKNSFDDHNATDEIKLEDSKEDSIDEELEEEKAKKMIFKLKDDLTKEGNLKEAYAEKLRKLQSEFDNYRRRTKEEREDIIETSNKELISNLLPVVDNFERAIKAAKENKDFDSLINGFNMVYNQLMSVLCKEGLSPIQSVGEYFYPKKHEACFIESSEDHEDNIVLEEWEKGYEYNGKIVRPSKVKVCKND